jgi:hypothetical protein
MNALKQNTYIRLIRFTNILPFHMLAYIHRTIYWKGGKSFAMIHTTNFQMHECSGYPTYCNTSYGKEEHLADHNSFISSLYILLSKEHVFMVIFLVYIEYQNFTRIHIDEIILQVLIRFEESNCL